MAFGFPFASRYSRSLVLGLVSSLCAGLASAATLKAEYQFDNSLSSSQSGAPVLVAANPYGSNVFLTDTVLGQSRTVYATNGTTATQAGLRLSATGLVSATDYSLDMVFSLTDGGPAYKRLFQTGTNDNGLYVDLDGKLNTYATGSNAGLAFSMNTYHHLVLTVSGGNLTKVWLDGTLSHTVTTNVLNITAPGSALSFFIDDAGEFANARTALIRMWDGTLTNGEVAALAAAPLASQATQDIPEPSPLVLLALGLGLAAWTTRRR